MKEDFDTLCEIIWGGSPATTMLADGVDGDSLQHDLSDQVQGNEGKIPMGGTKGSYHTIFTQINTMGIYMYFITNSAALRRHSCCSDERQEPGISDGMGLR